MRRSRFYELPFLPGEGGVWSTGHRSLFIDIFGVVGGL